MSIFQARFATWRPVALWIGGYQPNPNDPADQGWTWVTGEPWSYTNWAIGEPNDFSVPSGRESFLELWPTRSGQWNDNVDGSSISQGWYVVEYEAAIGVAFRRGDVNGDGVKDISDAIVTLTALFIGTVTLECEDAADVDDNGQLEITDPIVCLSLLFLGVGQLPPPINCGPDPTTDALDCQRHDPCRPPPIPDTRDLTWVGPKSYFPPPADQIVLAGFGINAVVDVLASGDLPITITRDIKNVGNRTVPAG